LRNHCPGSFTLGTLLPASIRRTLTCGFSARCPATTDPGEEPDPRMMKSYYDFISDDSLG
jgi:hypothetical protein